jgi:DNA-binding response OmpR family regulator
MNGGKSMQENSMQENSMQEKSVQGKSMQEKYTEAKPNKEKSTDNKPLILIVEDEEEVAKLYVRLLGRRGYQVVVAQSLNSARRLMDENKPDLFILDVMLPDGDGFEFCKELRKTIDTPILFLTGKSLSNDKVEGLESGGDYYLTKPFDKDEMVAAVQSLLRREEKMRKRLEELQTLTVGALKLEIPNRQVNVNNEDAKLTHTEFSILLILIKNKNNAISSDSIYKEIWGYTSMGNTDALRSHISRIKKKIHTVKTDDYDIIYIRGKGYMFITR